MLFQLQKKHFKLQKNGNRNINHPYYIIYYTVKAGVLRPSSILPLYHCQRREFCDYLHQILLISHHLVNVLVCACSLIKVIL